MVDQAAADEVDIADSWGASHAMRTAFKQKIALFRQKRQIRGVAGADSMPACRMPVSPGLGV
jgi:hypothetical protein